jgi:hypothetical protein
MSSPLQNGSVELVVRLRTEVYEARKEFDAARAELSLACKIVPDIGSATSDGVVLWERAHSRYRLAEGRYADALKRLVEEVTDIHLL